MAPGEHEFDTPGLEGLYVSQLFNLDSVGPEKQKETFLGERH